MARTGFTKMQVLEARYPGLCLKMAAMFDALSSNRAVREMIQTQYGERLSLSSVERYKRKQMTGSSVHRAGGPAGQRKSGALEAAEKCPTADNHPGAQSATPPESGGELFKTLPSSDEEGWRAERRGGADQGIKRLQRLKPRVTVSCYGGAEAPPFQERVARTCFVGPRPFGRSLRKAADLEKQVCATP